MSFNRDGLESSRLRKNSPRLLNGRVTLRLEALHAIAEPPISSLAGGPEGFFRSLLV